jgi:hypothetical protein
VLSFTHSVCSSEGGPRTNEIIPGFAVRPPLLVRRHAETVRSAPRPAFCRFSTLWIVPAAGHTECSSFKGTGFSTFALPRPRWWAGVSGCWQQPHFRLKNPRAFAKSMKNRRDFPHFCQTLGFRESLWWIFVAQCATKPQASSGCSKNSRL